MPGPCLGTWSAATNSMRVAALSTAFEPAKLEEGESLVPRLHPKAHGGPPGRPASPYAARHRFGRSLSVHSGRQKAKARRLSTPCHSQYIAHRGACGKTRVVLQNLRPKPEPAEIRGSRSTCALWTYGSRGTSNRGGTRGAFAGTRCGGAGVRAAGLRGATGRHATLLNGGFHD